MNIRDVEKHAPCRDGMDWLRTQPDMETAWLECLRGDWMLWLAGKMKADKGQLVRAACKCARLALRHVPEGERMPKVAIETAEAWCDGRAAVEDVRAAADAADAAAAAAAAADAAADAAAAAYVAVAAADAAAYVAAAAAYVAAAAADAAYAAAAAAAADAAYVAADAAAAAAAYVADAAYVARTLTLKACAEKVREVWPTFGDLILEEEE